MASKNSHLHHKQSKWLSLNKIKPLAKSQTTMTINIVLFHVECGDKTFDDVVYNKDLPNYEQHEIW